MKSNNMYEFLFECIEYTISTIIPDELAYLEKFAAITEKEEKNIEEAYKEYFGWHPTFATNQTHQNDN